MFGVQILIETDERACLIQNGTPDREAHSPQLTSFGSKSLEEALSGDLVTLHNAFWIFLIDEKFLKVLHLARLAQSLIVKIVICRGSSGIWNSQIPGS